MSPDPFEDIFGPIPEHLRIQLADVRSELAVVNAQRLVLLRREQTVNDKIWAEGMKHAGRKQVAK